MTTIAEIRAKFPQYAKETDGDLLMALHRKHYSHMHPRDFLDLIDGTANVHVTIKNPDLKAHWRSEVVKPRPNESEAQTRARTDGQLTEMPVNTGGKVGEAARSTLQGLTFGYGDEIVAAGHSLSPNVTYDQALSAERARLAQGEKNSPKTALAGEIGGGLMTAAISAPYAVGRGLLGTMGRGMGIGALEGALYGSGKGEGAGDRAKKMGQYGILGGLVGFGAPALVAGGKAALKAPVDWIGSSLNLGNLQRAQNALGATVRKAGMTPAEVKAKVAAAAADGQPEFRTMDALGRTGQRRASGLVRGGGDAADYLGDFLSERQMGQGDRVGAFIDDAFGTTGTTAKKTEASLKAAREADALVNYQAARGNSAPVNLGDTLDAIDDALRGVNSLDGGATALKETAIGRKLSSIKAQLQSGKYATIDFSEVLETKQELGRAIHALKKRGDSVPPAIADVFRKLDAALEGASDMYRKANDDYRVASNVIDAVDEGAMMQGRGRATDNVERFAAMTPDEQAAARVGYGDKALAKLEANASPTADKAKPFTSPKAVQEAGAMATDPALLGRRVAREGEMWRTQNRALGGSRTSDNIVDVDATNDVASGVVGAGRALLNVQLGDAVARLATVLGNKISGNNEATRRIIADALMSSDPVAALSAAVGRDVSIQNIQSALSAALRGSGRVAENRTGAGQGLLSGALR